MINGVRTFGFESFDEIVDFAIKEPCILVAINAEKIYHATDDTRAIINANIGYPDGIGAVYALRKKGVDQRMRIPGCDLWQEILKRHYKDKSFYFIGSKQEVMDQTIKQVKEEYPGVNIVAYRDGYFKPEEKEAIIQDIIAKKPDVVFVAQGSPRQELFMMEIFERHKALYQGLGGSFDLYIGNVTPTPKWIQDIGFHWLYRAIQEPKRIKRHGGLFMFMVNLVFNKKY